MKAEIIPTLEQIKAFNQNVVDHITSSRLEAARNLDAVFRMTEPTDEAHSDTDHKPLES